MSADSPHSAHGEGHRAADVIDDLIERISDDGHQIVGEWGVRGYEPEVEEADLFRRARAFRDAAVAAGVDPGASA